MKLCSLILVLIVLFSNITTIVGLRIDGSFVTNNFFKFVSKFGFIKTEKHQLKSSSEYGFIYGNITSEDTFPKDVTVTLAVLDRHHFLEFYGNR